MFYTDAVGKKAMRDTPCTLVSIMKLGWYDDFSLLKLAEYPS